MQNIENIEIENVHRYSPQKKYTYTPSTADSLVSIQNLEYDSEYFRQSKQVSVSKFIENEIDVSSLDHRVNTLSLEEEHQDNITMEYLHSYHLGQQYKDKSKKNDRFIPNRKMSKLSIALTQIHDTDEKKQEVLSLKGKPYKNENQISVVDLYKKHILGLNVDKKTDENNQQQQIQTNIFNYRNSPLKQNKQLNSLQDLLFDSVVDNYKQDSFKNIRKIQKIPFKVLDAPSLSDDFYLNLVDWSQQNMLAVALQSCVYLWSAATNKVVKFCDLGMSDTVTSVAWNMHGTALSVGTNLGDIQIYDAVKMKKISTLTGHMARVGSLAWSNQLLASGSRDKNILFRDLRSGQNYTKKLVGHKQEVCGLKWSNDDQQLASGGNDNKLITWNLHSVNPVCKFNQHQAAVKALAWSPHQHGLLASGGGTTDRTIRFWNTLNNTQIDWLDTGSQVCNLIFSKNVNELVSTHGYSQNQIVIWKYPTMERIAELTGHTSRVLYLSMSPDGETIVTGAGDETLRFWNIFPKKNQNDEYQSALHSNLKDFR